MVVVPRLIVTVISAFCPVDSPFHPRGVLVIVCISKTGVSAFLDYGVIYSRIQDNFSSHRFAGTSTGTGRDIHGGNFRAAFVLERQTDGCFILALPPHLR